MKRFMPALALALMPLTSAQADPRAWQDRLMQCLAEQARQRPFSGVVAAGQGEARFVQAIGHADAQGRTPLGSETPFRLASVGKVLTRVAVGLLIDAGKLQLDDPVRRHLPELPESFAPITLAHLLEHRAGVAAMTRPDLADAPTLAGAQRARDLVALVGAKPLAFEAGSREQYSNGGYLLLGAVIEAASGEAYRDHLQRALFAPLGMKGAGFEPGPNAAVPLTRMSPPGQPPTATPQPRREFPEFKATSAGDALSSAADLGALAQALVGDRLLSAPTKAAVFPRRGGAWRLGQLGGMAGSNTAFYVFPETQSWLIVLTNFDPPGGERMATALLPVLSGGACPVTPAGA
jgi:D-alanyl-D-alanine carboxypeptidase